MALQKKFNCPKATLQMFSSPNITPGALISLIRISSRMHGPITEEIRGDFKPKVEGKIKELLEMSAKATQ